MCLCTVCTNHTHMDEPAIHLILNPLMKSFVKINKTIINYVPVLYINILSLSWLLHVFSSSYIHVGPIFYPRLSWPNQERSYNKLCEEESLTYLCRQLSLPWDGAQKASAPPLRRPQDLSTQPGGLTCGTHSWELRQTCRAKQQQDGTLLISITELPPRAWKQNQIKVWLVNRKCSIYITQLPLHSLELWDVSLRGRGSWFWRWTMSLNLLPIVPHVLDAIRYWSEDMRRCHSAHTGPSIYLFDVCLDPCIHCLHANHWTNIPHLPLLSSKANLAQHFRFMTFCNITECWCNRNVISTLNKP